MTWEQFLQNYQEPSPALFTSAFIQRWKTEPWNPKADDQSAAGRLHMEVVSRIATQRLGYLDGVEKTALTSVYTLFEKTREAINEYPTCRHFEAIAWEVLNTHVRPFTAKWHGVSERGGLSALDSTDEFRAELDRLRPVFARFGDVLMHLRDLQAPPPRPPADNTAHEVAIEAEMARTVRWGIPARGDFDAQTAKDINQAEERAIQARRSTYELAADKPEAIGLALSGGGIRSATFSMGVLVALAKRDILKQFDYLSTVSGGGYLGSFLTAFLASPTGKDRQFNIGLQPDEVPFRKDEGEAEALRHLRHHSKYLATGSLGARLAMACAQVYGMVVNGASIAFIVTLGVFLEHWLRSSTWNGDWWGPGTLGVSGLLLLAALVAPLSLRGGAKWQRTTDAVLAILVSALAALLLWRALGWSHLWLRQPHTWRAAEWITMDNELWLGLMGALPVIASAFGAVFGRAFRRTGTVLVATAAIAAPLFLAGLYLAIYDFLARPEPITWLPLPPVDRGWFLAGVAVVLGIMALLQNINFTSPHRHYRNKLAEAYLIQAKPNAASTPAYQNTGDLRLSAVLGQTHQRGPYPLLNGALNVPHSRNPKMQGRKTDFFLFSPAYCGSPLTGYATTALWEEADPHLNLGTAMAISAAAAAPQMGLGTIKGLSLWLVLLNIRLGYWVRKPTAWQGSLFRAPGIRYLVKEMLGRADEKTPWLNVSDGGHIENLGVYELLRRRCKYIVSVDGEQDPRMTFAALTTLQRLAAIDLGVHLDVNLDDLRLNEQGYSRSHFRFCRIEYPEGTCGYLIYAKLSLTGNEGEFLRRYRLDEPAFPHHSTADQFFSEAQFEAYRSLGEHVGEKLFLRAIAGPVADEKKVRIEEWFLQLGKNLLEPKPAPAETSQA